MIEKYEHDIPALTDDDLETLIDMFQTELQIRKDERDKIRQYYQDDLDRLLAAMKGDGFYITTPDNPAGLTDYVVERIKEH